MTRPSPQSSGFRKLGTVGAASKETGSLKGTRTSLHSTLQQTSTGIQSLDLLLGNGINLSSSLLIQEQDRGEYSPVFARHFISEGITHGHTVVCIGERVASWLDNLPKPIEQNTDAQTQDEDSLKIAWRYKRKIQTRFSHSYDMSQQRPSEDISNCRIFTNSDPSYDDLYIFIESAVHDNEDNVVRIVLDRPMFPVADEAAFLRFHYNLRKLSAKKNVVTLCLYPVRTMSDSLSFYLTQLYNYVLSVESLPRDKKSIFKDYHGILHLVKVANMCTFTMPLHDMTDRFFKVQRKKFIIEKMHLPPDLSETVSRSSNSPSANCASSKGIDF
ncbi:elongator complex protein 4-like [Bolinopsis microptera]|uniref:elongator complex protein 4-like n=1 Tax=Bolinopsis microptera TaxID=2820187 RepID=UPI00307B09D8